MKEVLFTIGADPEYFMLDEKDIPLSSVGVIGGTKTSPREISERCSVHEDNVALEITVPPSRSEDEFVSTIAGAISDVKKVLGCKLSVESSLIFPESELESKEAMEFGCSADYDAHTGEVNTPPFASETKLRSCGGHIHVGYPFVNPTQSKAMVLLMDAYLGLPSVLIDNGEERKKLYGKASAFREKPFGFEYRTLSNFWTMDETLIKWVYNSVKQVVDLVRNEKEGHELPPETIEQIRAAINSSDKELATSLIKELQIPMP